MNQIEKDELNLTIVNNFSWNLNNLQEINFNLIMIIIR